jgi:hypothetical protein
MSSRIAMPLEAQASALVSFLTQAQHALSPDIALEICSSMRAAREPHARFLRDALAARNIELKHTSCLKALALMDGYNGHVSRPRFAWVVARYIFDAPAITPRIKHHDRSTDATADLCTRLADDLSDAKEIPYVRIERHGDYLEFIFVGEPQPGARYILACKNPDGAPARIPDDEGAAAIERVRRLVEGQFRGWLDGAAKIPFDRTGNLRLIKNGEPVVEGPESAVLAACESDPDFPLNPDTLLSQPASARRYRIVHALAGDAEPVPVDDALVERVWRRLEAFYRFHEDDFSWFLSNRQKEEQDGRFRFDGIDTEHLVRVLADRSVSPETVMSMVGMDAGQWDAMMETEELPRETLLRLVEKLGLSSANELYEDSRAPAWMPVKDGEEIALWMRNFDHLRLSVSGIAEGASPAFRCLERLDALHVRSPDATKLQAVLSDAESAGLRLCATIGKRFVADLPVFRERLALVGHLSFWDRKEMDKWAPPAKQAEEAETEPWTEMDEEYLKRFNTIDMTVGDLIALQEEVTRSRQDGQEPGWDTATFAAARVFRGKPDAPHRAHTAVTRMTAVSRLISSGALAIWMERSNEPDVEMVPQNVLQAAARCPLVRTGNDVGFDPAAFQRLALELAA